MKAIKEKYWHETFIFAIVIKSFTGITETLSGLVLLFINPVILNAILNRLSRGEQLEDPKDFFLVYAQQYISHLTSGTQIFAGLYILSHGIINLFLVLGLIKEKTWAYLVGIGILFSFMMYQLFRIALHHSLFMEVITVFDVFFIVLIWHEYNYLTKKLANKA